MYEIKHKTVKTIANIKVSYVDSFITYEKSGVCTAVNKGCIRLRLRTGATHVETDELNRVQLVHFRACVAAVRKRKG